MSASKTPMHSNTASAGDKSTEMNKSMDMKLKIALAIPMSGDADQDFSMMMKEHHQTGINMAETELKQGKNPELKKMATKIITAKKKEIAEFDAWLKKHPSSK